MAQFYLLSVLLNIVAGLILVYGKNLVSSEFGDESENFIVGKVSLDSRELRLVVGILSLLVGLMKILSVFRNDIPVIGDLLPALAGFAASCSILLEYYLCSGADTVAVSDTVQDIFISSRRVIGFVCLGAALLHFIFPQVLFL